MSVGLKIGFYAVLTAGFEVLELSVARAQVRSAE